MKTLTAIKLAAIVGALAYSAARADTAIPLSTMDAEQPSYQSADAAAIAALEASARLSRLVEFAGAVYYSDGVFHYTIPVTTGNARDVEGYRIAITRRGTVIALYHTHPADLTNDQSDCFSPADVLTAKAMHLISYVGVLKSGRVIQFDYRHDKTRSMQDSAHISGDRMSDGHSIGLFARGSNDQN